MAPSAGVRIAEAPIRERGLIATPDLVVVADATLLDDPQAQPLQGLIPTGTVRINAGGTPASLRQCYGLAGTLAILDGEGEGA